MGKKLFLIKAPFQCKGCDEAEKYLPEYCEENGWDFKTIIDGEDREFPVEYYPTIYATVNEKIVKVIKGFTIKRIENKLKKL